MRKTIASQNIIRPRPDYPFFISTTATPTPTPSPFLFPTCLKLIRIAYPMDTSNNIEAPHLPYSPTIPQESNQNHAIIVLNPVPITDPHQQLTPQQNGESHCKTVPNSHEDSHNDDLPVTTNQDNGPLDNNSSFVSQPQNLSMLHSTLQVDMTLEMNKYFEQCASAIKEFDLHRDKFVMVSNHNIKKMIKSGQVKISDKREDLALKERERVRTRELDAKRRQVQMQKYQIIRKLKTIEQQQIELVHMSIKYGRNRSVQMKKVSFSAQEKQKVAQLLRAKREFEISLTHKTDEHIKHSQQLKKIEEEEVKKMQQAQNKRKKQQIAQRLKQMELKTQQRKEILKNSVLKIKHNYIHRQIQKKYKSLQKISEQQTQNKLKELSMKHKLNIEKIKEHDKKYSELLQKRSISLSQIKPNTQVQTKRYESSHFGKVIDEELFEIKQRNIRKQMKIKQNEYKSKILKYQQKIDKEHKPKVDPTKIITVVFPRACSFPTLSKEERTEKGLQYLAKARQMKRRASEVEQVRKQQQNYGYKAYKDYLRERQSSNVDATEKELKEIMSKKDNNDYNALLRAKFLAEGLSAKSKKSEDDRLYFSAKTKLSLLSQLY